MKILENGLICGEFLVLLRLNLINFNKETIEMIKGDKTSDDDFNI